MKKIKFKGVNATGHGGPCHNASHTCGGGRIVLVV